MAIVHDIDQMIERALPMPRCIYERLKVQARRDSLKEDINNLMVKCSNFEKIFVNENRIVGTEKDSQSSTTGTSY